MTKMQTEPRAIRRWQAIDWWWNQRLWRVYEFLLSFSWGQRQQHALSHIRGPRVLEVSFGVGYLMSLYADKYEVTGIDYNPRCVEAARRRLARRKLQATLLEGDAHALPFPDASFDTVINTDAFTLYDDPQAALDEHFRVLTPGGRLILMEYDSPRNGNLRGRMWVFGARNILAMPRLDLEALHRKSGFDYQDYDVGGFGAFHMYVSTKEARQGAEPLPRPAPSMPHAAVPGQSA
ncbi:MAG: class I SAM-dependent methyltransferase [Myxococcales bacterium]|nr:class I SAM-dependent methyltransferase [Myxococcales bacterium]MDD9969155.1 class I SAM-dependent methyltransferase [Myxococcales bacterium]